mmetsp:Transcript_2138/g.4985  ORF Transcript_2138/g.4985 Transcript_2138/m.4985 type:complete len:463 (-) Transcript_2138:271-1659(-)
MSTSSSSVLRLDTLRARRRAGGDVVQASPSAQLQGGATTATKTLYGARRALLSVSSSGVRAGPRPLQSRRASGAVERGAPAAADEGGSASTTTPLSMTTRPRSSATAEQAEAPAVDIKFKGVAPGGGGDVEAAEHHEQVDQEDGGLTGSAPVVPPAGGDHADAVDVELTTTSAAVDANSKITTTSPPRRISTKNGDSEEKELRASGVEGTSPASLAGSSAACTSPHGPGEDDEDQKHVSRLLRKNIEDDLRNWVMNCEANEEQQDEEPGEDDTPTASTTAAAESDREPSPSAFVSTMEEVTTARAAARAPEMKSSQEKLAVTRATAASSAPLPFAHATTMTPEPEAEKNKNQETGGASDTISKTKKPAPGTTVTSSSTTTRSGTSSTSSTAAESKKVALSKLETWLEHGGQLDSIELDELDLQEIKALCVARPAPDRADDRYVPRKARIFAKDIQEDLQDDE